MNGIVDIGAFESNQRMPGIASGTTNGGTSRIELGGVRERSFLSLRVVGAPSGCFWLESSTDLLHWVAAVSMHADTNGCAEFRSLVSTNEPMKFFRVRK